MLQGSYGYTMPGSITHIAIADKIIELIGDERFDNIPLFYCGNIGPDAIHARPGFCREDKKRTHLREGIRDAEFLKEESQELFHNRVKSFINERITPGNKYNDFLKGYVVHLLSDELFMKTVRLEFIKSYGEDAVHGKELFESFMRDLDDIDYRLAREYPFSRNVREELYKEWGYSVDGLLIHEELSGSKWWVCDKFFDNKNMQFKTPKHITYSRMIEFIKDCAMNVVVQLSDDKMYRSLF